MNDVDFTDAVSVLPDKLRSALNCVSENIQKDTYEIRLRLDKPLMLCGIYGNRFVSEDGSVSSVDYRNALRTDKNTLSQAVSSICGYSVYSHQKDIAEGFVTYNKGHRAGFCGTAVHSGNSVTAMRNITSVNIRISRFIENAADELIARHDIVNNFNGIIIAGPPCSGKTTVLKCFAEKISSLYNLRYKKTVVIDERFEFGDNIGVNCDVLRGYGKEDGITHAIRVLSPDVIICDEVVTENEAEKITAALYSGVKFAVSVHANDVQQMKNRPVIRKLLTSGYFDYVFFLKNVTEKGIIVKTVDTEEFCIGNNSSGDSYCQFGIDSV